MARQKRPSRQVNVQFNPNGEPNLAPLLKSGLFRVRRQTLFNTLVQHRAAFDKVNNWYLDSIVEYRKRTLESESEAHTHASAQLQNYEK